ncbi:hypothetical protein [Pseudomonas moraviensis]|uniref:hypothetical protein n=1 Tax=Pseudomonas moraviensis TaxID=321662 RepID=UPI000935B300|nr:hypothetical protein [Pseudomonas moraviensis]OJT50011.1 hypothetical protein BSZ28_18440 [Pseudomonas moraviensis]
MDYALIANASSLVCGVMSAAFWVRSAVVKAPPPPGFENSPDGDYYKAKIVNGGELYGTLRLQSKWNSRAAFAASATIALQVFASLIGVFTTR